MTPTPSEPGSSQHSQYGPLQESPQVFQTALRRPNPPSTGGTHLRWPSQTPESVAPMQAVLSHEQATAWLVAHPPSQLTTAEGFMYDAVYQQVNAEAVRLQGLLLALQGAQPPAPARSTMSLPLPEQVYPGYTSNPRGPQSMPTGHRNRSGYKSSSGVQLPLLFHGRLRRWLRPRAAISAARSDPAAISAAGSDPAATSAAGSDPAATSAAGSDPAATSAAGSDPAATPARERRTRS